MPYDKPFPFAASPFSQKDRVSNAAGFTAVVCGEQRRDQRKRPREDELPSQHLDAEPAYQSGQNARPVIGQKHDASSDELGSTLS